MNYSDKQIEALIKGIEDGYITERDLPVGYYKALTEYLTKAVYEGFGHSLETIGRADLPLLEELLTNVYTFGAAKTFKLTKEISGLLVDENGKVRSSRDFNKIARETYDNWNDNWGRTEYNTAVGSADMAAKWREIENQKDILPVLKYDAVIDPNTSDICRPLDGITAPVGDPIWSKISPLNHFNCFKYGTKVLTQTGWREIQTIQEGELVIGGSGKAHDVTAVHVNSFDGEIVRLTIKDNTVSSTENHRFLTLDGWKQAGNIACGDIVIQNIEISFVDKIISTVNNINTLSTYLAMPIVRQWESTMINTFDTYIKRTNKYINEPAVKQFVANTINTSFVKVVKKTLFALSKFGMILFVPFWVFIICLNSLIVSPLTNFFVKHWVKFLHSIRGVRPKFSNSPMRVITSYLCKIIPTPFLSLVGVNPLSFYSFTSSSWGESIVSKQSHEGSIVNTPQSTNLSESKHFNEITDMEGFTAGAPLDKFNTFNSFLLHSFCHRKMFIVKNVERENYKGQIYNLSVSKDESYITNVGVVHNCRCVLMQLSGGRATKDRDKIVKEVEDKMQPMFVNNVGQTGMIFTKDHPYYEMAKEDKAFAKKNFNLPIPKFDKPNKK